MKLNFKQINVTKTNVAVVAFILIIISLSLLFLCSRCSFVPNSFLYVKARRRNKTKKSSNLNKRSDNEQQLQEEKHE